MTSIPPNPPPPPGPPPPMWFGPPPLPPPAGPTPKKGPSGLSIAALVVGICGCLVLTIPLGVVLGILALVQAARKPAPAPPAPPQFPNQMGLPPPAAASGGKTATRVLAIVGLVMAVLWAGVWGVGVLLVLSAQGCHKPDPGYANVCTLKPGQCFDNPDTSQLITTVKLDDCDTPHNAQAIGAFTERSGSFPGREGYLNDAETRCQDISTKNVDSSKVGSGDEMGYLAPDSNSWNAGYHTVICTVSTTSTWSSTVLTPDADLSIPTK